MRSSVTVLFSNPSPDTTMHYPDYRQKAEDHGCILILIKPIGQQMPPKSFNSLFERISRLQHIKIPESQTGGQRGIWVRYKKSYPKESNEWGDFQAHRKVLGLICIGKCGSQDEFDELCKEHEKIRDGYISTLYDSRCVVFKNNEPRKSSPQHKNTCLLNHIETNHINQELNGDNHGTPLSPTNSSFPDGDGSEISIDRDSGVYDTCAQNLEMVDSPRSHSPKRILELHVGNDNTDENKELGNVDENCTNSLINNSTSPIPSNSDSESSLPFLTPAIPSPTTPASPIHDGNFRREQESPNSPLSPNTPLRDAISPSDHSSSSTHTTNSQKSDASSDSSSHHVKPFQPPQSHKTTVLYYENHAESARLEKDLYDFICSLFWVLESKRLDRSHEKVDKLPLLFAPFERRDFVGLDMESRTNKKRSVGRMKKHIGDLCMLAGLPADSINYYNAATDHLKSANDWLWLAGCYEGSCSASVLLLYPYNRWPSSLQRNSSFTAGVVPTINIKIRPGVFSSLPNGIDPSEYKNKACLSPSEIIDKYHEAIGHYHKYHSAAIIETEASIKACHVLIQQEKYLHASEFLQNANNLILQLSEDEKIRKFSEISLLYRKLGFHRKAAFFKRVAATRCVTPQLANPYWSECYSFLLQTLDGYKLTLDPRALPKDITYGWPVLQIHILLELVAASRRMGNTALSVRHMTFLIHSMFEHLTQVERNEFAHQLEGLTARCEGAPVPLALDNGTVIPPVNLINLPKIKSFKLQNLAPHLQPIRLVPQLVENFSSGPFIFSPLQFVNTKDKNRNTTKMDFQWVEGDVCEVSVQVYNPLPFELKVTNMGLLPDGIAFETFPSCLSLPAESGPFPVNLLGTPRSTGELVILGYTTHVLGVKSNCRLKDIAAIKKPCFTIDVVPALPQIQLMTSLPKSPIVPSVEDAGSVVTSAHLSLFTGESCECTISLMNTGKQNVETVELMLDTKLENEFKEEFCKWRLEDLKSYLPIAPNNSASFNVVVQAVGDFLGNGKQSANDICETASTSSTPSKSKTVRTSSISSFGSSRSSFAYSSLRGRFPDLFSAPPVPPPIQPTHQTKTIEGILRLRYSGGSGLKAGYCRQCSVAFNVEVIPSIVITKWDVLPAEIPSNCYLVLDMLNVTDHEMEVQYAPYKRILIEAHDTCRIPVPVQRCPFAKLSGLSEEEIEKVCRQHVSELVDLQWTIPATETKGKASISSLVWNSAMLDMIKMCPIQWEVLLNDYPFKPEDEFSFPVGEVVNVCIIIFNHSDFVMSDLCLNIQCYQDYQNGQTSYRVDGKLIMVGCDKAIILKIPKHDSYRHFCGLMFFCPGTYKLDVQCQQEPRPLAGAGKGSASEGRTWKCTPTIEINVTE